MKGDHVGDHIMSVELISFLLQKVSFFSKEVAYSLSIGHNKFVVSPWQITSTMQTNSWNPDVLGAGSWTQLPNETWD